MIQPELTTFKIRQWKWGGNRTDQSESLGCYLNTLSIPIDMAFWDLGCGPMLCTQLAGAIDL
jgi:hypothetical protein